MRSNIIISANIAAAVAHVNVVVVDVIRSASAAGLRLYGHTWQQYGQTWFKPTTPKPSECDAPCLDLRCLGGDLLGGCLSGTGMPMSLSMRFRTVESLGLIPRS